MKKVSIAVFAALLIGAMSSQAQTTNVTGVTTNNLGSVFTDRDQTTATLLIPIDFSGSVIDATGKTVLKPTTKDLGDTNVQWAALQQIVGVETTTTLELITGYDEIDTNGVTNSFTVATTNEVVTVDVVTNQQNAIVGTLVTTNEVPIGGGTNLLVVIKEAKKLLTEKTAFSTDKSKIWAIYEGPVGTNDLETVKRQLLLTGSASASKISVKAQGVWEDGVSALKSGTVKNAKK
jgi:hypothetical protein